MGNQFKGFLAGRPQMLRGGVVEIECNASFTDIINFALSTKQGAGERRDERAEILPRINNVVKLHGDTVELSDADRTYLTTKLKPIIDGTGNPWIKGKRQRGEYDALGKLVSHAKAR